MNLVSFENTYMFEEDGNKAISIDGFGADENAEGEVVCVVWCTKHKDIVVDFHNNAYRYNDIVNELIKESIDTLLQND